MKQPRNWEKQRVLPAGDPAGETKARGSIIGAHRLRSLGPWVEDKIQESLSGRC